MTVLFIGGCKTNYEHLTGYPSASDRIVSNDYRYLKKETYFFSSGQSIIMGTSGESRDKVQLKNGSSQFGLVKEITNDSIYLEGQSFPANFVSSVDFGSNPNKATLQAKYETIKKVKQTFLAPTYYYLTAYVQASYGVNAIHANAVWDVMSSGMKREFLAVTFDIYIKK